MRAVQLTAFGNPVDGLEYVDIPEPDAPGPNQVLIGVEFSPIDPSDLLLALGIYALRPALPTVIGNEGVGRVLAVRQGVESVKKTFTFEDWLNCGRYRLPKRDGGLHWITMLSMRRPSSGNREMFFLANSCDQKS